MHCSRVAAAPLVAACEAVRPRLPTCRCLVAAAGVPRRRFANGPNFGGFPFGGGFPGGPPRGDSDKFYRLLGVDKNASESEIKSAYRKKAMKNHPDRGGDEATFKEISRAYEVLSNPEKKQVYDTYGEEGLEGMEKGGGGGQPSGDPFDLFSTIFGFSPGSRRGGRPVTQNSVYELHLTLEEFYQGTNRSIVFNRDVLCKTCRGVGGYERRQCSKCGGTGRQVTMQQMGMFVQQFESACSACRGKGYVIPPGQTCKSCKGKCTSKEKKTFSIDVERGMEDGKEFHFRGQADEAPDHDTGDVIIVLRQKAHRTFQRIKSALVIRQKISLQEALCGFQFSVDFLDGQKLDIRSTPGQVAKPGEILLIPGKGMPKPHGQKPGDLLLFLDVMFPESLSVESQKQLAEVFGDTYVAKEPSSNAEVPRRLGQSQERELKRFLEEAKRESSSQGQGQQQPGCAQQ